MVESEMIERAGNGRWKGIRRWEEERIGKTK
jgi:hypothetical protein